MAEKEVLATFFGDEEFPVEWESEEEKELFWWFDDNHCMHPVSPMYYSLDGWWGPTLEYMYRRFGAPFGKAWEGKRVNGYLYSAVLPREGARAARFGPYYGWLMPTYANNFLDWWRDRYLPEIKANCQYLDDELDEATDKTLPELMFLLEEAIDIQYRHFCIHWILNLAQFQSSMDFQAAVQEVIGDVNPQLIGRILISKEDRNWDSIDEAWRLKEKVMADPDLKAIFDGGDTAAAIMPALATSEKGRAFMEDIEGYAKEFGYKAIFPHEYINKLWVEDVTPIVETIKGYVASDYDFPSVYQRSMGDQAAAMEELRDMVPDTATEEQVQHVEEKMALAVKMMPLTPDHHFYIDQGTFGRLRLVLMAIGRHMVEKGLIDVPEDIMFLEYEQLQWYLANPKTEDNPDGSDGRGVIKAARRAWDDSWKKTPRSWVGTVTQWSMYEEPYHTLWGWPQRFEREQAGLDQVEGVVEGLPGSAGIVEATARVVWGPDEFDKVRDGEIVVCITTNPAWVVVFSKIAGVVTDTGGVLAHPAVVAREFAIPCVVGTGNATRRINTGDRVRVNGNTGKVEVISKAA